MNDSGVSNPLIDQLYISMLEYVGEENITVDPVMEMTEDDIRDVIMETGDDIREESTKIERLEVVSAALESIVDSLRSDVTLTSTERAMVLNTNLTLEHALDLPSQSVQLGLESVGTESMALLTVVALIEALWKTIKNIIISIWAKIKAFINAVTRTIGRLEKAFGQLQKKLGTAAAKQMSFSNPIELGADAKWLRYGLDTFTDSATMRDAYVELSRIGQWVIDDYSSQLTDIGGVIYNKLNDFDLNDCEVSLIALNSAVSRVSQEAIKTSVVHLETDRPTPVGVLVNRLSMQIDRSPRFNGNVLQSTEVMGLGRFYLKEHAVDQKTKANPSYLDNCAAFQGMRVVFLPSEVFHERTPTKFTLAEPLKLQHIAEICDHGMKMCSLISKWYGNTMHRRLEISRKAIEKKTEELNQHAKQMEEFSSESMEYYKLAMKYNETFATWVTSPAIDFIAHAANVSQAIFLACAKSINAYTAQ